MSRNRLNSKVTKAFLQGFRPPAGVPLTQAMSSKRKANEKDENPSGTKKAKSSARSVAATGAKSVAAPRKARKAVAKVPETYELLAVTLNAVSADRSRVFFTSLARYVREKTGGITSFVKMFGKDVKEPRLKVFCARDPMSSSYAYSGVDHKNHGWPDELEQLSIIASRICGTEKRIDFRRAVINLYRDGNDSIGAHRDKDSTDSPIVSFSFYEKDDQVRHLVIRHSPGKKALEKAKAAGGTGPKLNERIAKVPMPQGSALIMKPGMQELCTHEVPKQAGAGARINVTLRC